MKLPAALNRLIRGLTAWLATANHHHLRGNQEVSTSEINMRTDGGCLVEPLRWGSVGGELKVNDNVFHLKGTNWYGFETEKDCPHGLDYRTMDEIFQFLKDNKFNAIRFPFSLKYANDFDGQVNFPFKDADLYRMTRRQLMNRVVEKAADYHILVLLDMHRLNDQFIPQLWYSDDHPIDDVLKGWDTVLGDLKKHWNVFGVDLKNEPFGVATWGTSSPSTDWNKGAIKIGTHILSNHGDWGGLVFVEGINYSTDFRGIRSHPIDFGREAWNNRLVLSPHQYGPSVVDLPMFRNKTFPDNMPEEWTTHWGFLEEETGRATVLGEWGGRYTGLDKVWQDAFADYLLDMCLSDQFQWDLNPDSSDTGGLFKDDWSTPETAKLNVIDRVQPNPSFLYLDNTSQKICLEPGCYANSKCDTATAAAQ